MISPETEEALEAAEQAIGRDFEPARWMQYMERVVNAYKQEAELLRTEVRALSANLKSAVYEIEALQERLSTLEK